jgi:hypothetical protein
VFSTLLCVLEVLTLVHVYLNQCKQLKNTMLKRMHKWHVSKRVCTPILRLRFIFAMNYVFQVLFFVYVITQKFIEICKTHTKTGCGNSALEINYRS